ncbi:serine-rich adhesin for platelets-like protein [Arabidopsis thaliana]|jgi:hypothetical protein|nr:serine-rich adhesin for platelets-like protein [Arabidopsis thaliana]NP_001325711.1 serine-rich adhesin for platelets-like protein [Arabidopsis thaliana]AEE74292.1 serine-rich adhesin for platelets-like protein [Arabidopsis thaliana]ANM63636.1 serine-rich adhesin for platelets-like protein [Arabidopsis thaliana]|eukprot:NP_001030647.1 serine-rich adhesin for platelets-like protein [Arabidopsis thaliana]
MGLESIPVPNALEPRRNPDFDPYFLRSSRKASTWDAYENLGYVNLRSDYDGISWDHLDSRMNKECNRPIDRFQTETLPPRSAKPIPVTHNRLLSPIRSPGFVQSRNPASVMEEASRMIEPSPRVVAKTRFSSSDSSSSLPMKIRDLKEKLEASQKGQSPQISNGTCNNKCFRGKQDEKRTTLPLKTQERNNLLGESRFGGSKGKVKPPSVSAHAKANTIHKRDSSMLSNGYRDQKKKVETKNRIVKSGLKESSASTRKTVDKPNNQKQNQFAETSVSNQRGRKVMKKVNKVLVENGTTTKKPGFTATSAKKSTSSSLSRKKNLSRSKKPANGVQEAGVNSDKRIKKGEKVIKCNITVDGGLKTGDDDRKKDMDVISFTFSSPIKGLSSDSQYFLKKNDQDAESALCFNKIDSDSLNFLLEKKLRELTSKMESSCSSLTQEEESSGSITKDWVNGTRSLPSDDQDNGLSESESDSDYSSSFYKKKIFQAEDDEEVNSFSTAENLQISCSTSFSSSRNDYHHNIEETELSESVALSEAEEGHDWELEYITEIIASGQLMIKEFSLGMATDILPLSLFDETEGKRDARGKIERKTLFDLVNQWLTLKCEQMFMGTCKGVLGKQDIFLERREILADQVLKEAQGLKKMREMMMDELVDNDMSSCEGKWLDYMRETYEEGIEIEEEIVSELVDDLINDLIMCC